MKGCLGCLGLLVGLSLLAWPIEQLQRVFGWSDAQTGYLLLVVFGLLAIGAAGGRATRRRQSERPRGRVAAARPVRREQAAGRLWAPTAEVATERPNCGPPNRRAERRPSQYVPRARDPLRAQLRFRVLERDGFRCRYCGRTASEPGVVLHVDHVVPVSAGGATREDNLRTACEECNLGKAARLVVVARPA
jgi:5-methylcytosine-specific restriction endonuclease McrA